jgi:putative two-component system response regulator
MRGERTAAPEIAAGDVRLAIVDDEARNVALLERILKAAGYRHIASTTCSPEAIALCTRTQPDLLLLDLRMPELDGLGVLDALAPLRAGTGRFPVLVLTGDTSIETRRDVLTAGADDFLLKPFDHLEALLRVRQLVANHRLQAALRDDNTRLELAVEQRTAELELAREETLERLALASEFRDDDTHQHARRIGRAAAQVADAMEDGALPPAAIERAAPLHDIGKLAISDTILLKPGPLTPGEYETMKTHTTVGAEILGGSRSAVLRMAEEIAKSHHERWNGDGYPMRLTGTDIPLTGRIVAVVDMFDALTHERPYKHAWPLAQALDELHRQSGRMLDPDVVAVFMALDHDALLSAA